MSRAIDNVINDPVADAEALLGAPYLLGGRNVEGIDCSGLVQIAFSLAGHAVQRDSDLQQATLGSEIDESAVLRRGDLVFFSEHVGLMTDSETLIHASGHGGVVGTELLADVVARISQKYDTTIFACRRLG